MANGIRTGDPVGFNKGHSSKFRGGSRIRQKPVKWFKHMKKAGGHLGRNVLEITIKMKTIVRKPLMIFKYNIFALHTRINMGKGSKSIQVFQSNNNYKYNYK